MKIRLALSFFLLCPDVTLSLSCWLAQFSWASQQFRDRAMPGHNNLCFLIWPILFLYYNESLVSSNLNSKLFRFHCAHPNVGKYDKMLTEMAIPLRIPILEESKNGNLTYFGDQGRWILFLRVLGEFQGRIMFITFQFQFCCITCNVMLQM